MFFKKKLTLEQAVVKLETIFYPQLESAIRHLSINVMVLAANWTGSMSKSCNSLFLFYKYLIEFNNFQELTLDPLIVNLLGNAILIK